MAFAAIQMSMRRNIRIIRYCVSADADGLYHSALLKKAQSIEYSGARYKGHTVMQPFVNLVSRRMSAVLKQIAEHFKALMGGTYPEAL